MFLAGFLMMLAGVGVFLLGRHGFLLGTHPFCRACQYDLHMLPLETARCPECGADILAEEGIRVGYRQRSGVGMAVGVALAMIGVGAMARVVPGWWARFDGSSYKPLAWLDISAADEGVRGRACDEVLRRINAGRVSGREMDVMAEKVLRLQGDASVAWNRRWGDIVERGHWSKGAGLSAKVWEKYLEQSMQVTARMRPRVRVGDPVPVMVSCEVKGSSRTESDICYVAEVEIRVGDKTSVLRGEGRRQSFYSPVEWSLVWMPEFMLGKGAQLVECSVRVEARDGAVAAVRREKVTVGMEVMDAGESSVRLVVPADEKARGDLAGALHWRVREVDGVIHLTDATTLGSLWIAEPPVTAAFRIVLRQGQNEWRLARCMVRPDDAATVGLALPAFDPRHVPMAGAAEIVCIPDPATAAGTVDVVEVWGGEVRQAVVLGP